MNNQTIQTDILKYQNMKKYEKKLRPTFLQDSIYFESSNSYYFSFNIVIYCARFYGLFACITVVVALQAYPFLEEPLNLLS